MRASERRAEAFRRLDLHDDTLLDIRLIPPARRRGASSLRVELLSAQGKGRRVLELRRMSECGGSTRLRRVGLELAHEHVGRGG